MNKYFTYFKCINHIIYQLNILLEYKKNLVKKIYYTDRLWQGPSWRGW